LHNTMMTYASISIIITSLGSIILAVLAVKPREKKRLVKKEFLDEYESVLFYQDMADMDPVEYLKKTNKVLKSEKQMRNNMISHLHILGAEIKQKYFWLKKAYTFFSVGLVVSAMIIIMALTSSSSQAVNMQQHNAMLYKEGKFYNIFEPSGVTTLNDGKILIAEDDANVKALKLIEFGKNGNIVELGNLYIPKKLKKRFKKVEDIEAVTSIGNAVFLVTSHSLTREKERKKSREKLVMFYYDDMSMVDLFEYTTLKDDLKEAFPKLFATLFDVDDLNIEGLCVDEDGDLLIGLRAPLANFNAILIKITNPRKLFIAGEKVKFSEPIYLSLDGLGIRDITYDKAKNGYWILAGASGAREGGFLLYFWSKKTNQLNRVPNQPDMGYAEGISVVEYKNKPALFIVEDDGQKPNKAADYVIMKRDDI